MDLGRELEADKVNVFIHELKDPPYADEAEVEAAVKAIVKAAEFGAAGYSTPCVVIPGRSFGDEVHIWHDSVPQIEEVLKCLKN